MLVSRIGQEHETRLGGRFWTCVKAYKLLEVEERVEIYSFLRSLPISTASLV